MTTAKEKVPVKQAHIIYKNYLRPDGAGKSIGGIQTYIDRLIPVLIRKGYAVSVHQIADAPFTVRTENATVYGYPATGKLEQALYEGAKQHIDPEKDLVIYGNEALIVKNGFRKSIGIQHGISWDRPKRVGCKGAVFLADYVQQCIDNRRTVTRIKQVKKLVCVDYNFVNWYRAQVAYPQVDMAVIPNFSEIPDPMPQKDFEGKFNIIFARRLFDYRGTRIFAGAIRRILGEYPDITVTVAGEGPDEEYLKKELGSFGNVRFIRYKNEESLAIHADKQIALVPTLGSEGTSLSLLEAMASRCAVICTNVGGMTNIVIDNYNGLMIRPKEEELYEAVRLLLEDRVKARRLADTAYAVAKAGFSLDVWEKKWEKVIDEAENIGRD